MPSSDRNHTSSEGVMIVNHLIILPCALVTDYNWNLFYARAVLGKNILIRILMLAIHQHFMMVNLLMMAVSDEVFYMIG
jgi:hypothetical protein